MSNSKSDIAKLGKLMIAVVAIIVAIWIAVKVVIPLVGFILGTILPLAIVIFIGWFIYKIMMSESPKTS